MKFMKWKKFIITALVCLLPIVLGLALWNRLPDTVAIHFNIHGEADGWASKPFAVFGLPVMMAALQFFCCFVNDINAHHNGERKKFSTITKWIIPVMCIVLQIATLGYGLGWNIDMRRVAMIILSTIFIVLGNYMPKFDHIKNCKVDAEKARKVNRFIGIEMVILGILALISIFLPPIYSVIWLILLIPFVITSIIYGIVVAKK